MSGTEIAYQVHASSSGHRVAPYPCYAFAMRGLVLTWAMVLCVRYAKSRTDLGYGATRHALKVTCIPGRFIEEEEGERGEEGGGREGGEKVPLKTVDFGEGAEAETVGSAICLRAWYALPGTDTVYGAM
eukprot:1018555-Rhodomonas_salina.1